MLRGIAIAVAVGVLSITPPLPAQDLADNETIHPDLLEAFEYRSVGPFREAQIDGGDRQLHASVVDPLEGACMAYRPQSRSVHVGLPETLSRAPRPRRP